MTVPKSSLIHKKENQTPNKSDLTPAMFQLQKLDKFDKFEKEIKRLKHLANYVHAYRDSLAKVVSVFCDLRFLAFLALSKKPDISADPLSADPPVRGEGGPRRGGSADPLSVEILITSNLSWHT